MSFQDGSDRIGFITCDTTTTTTTTSALIPRKFSGFSFDPHLPGTNTMWGGCRFGDRDCGEWRNEWRMHVTWKKKCPRFPKLPRLHSFTVVGNALVATKSDYQRPKKKNWHLALFIHIQYFFVVGLSRWFPVQTGTAKSMQISSLGDGHSRLRSRGKNAFERLQGETFCGPAIKIEMMTDLELSSRPYAIGI